MRKLALTIAIAALAAAAWAQEGPATLQDARFSSLGGLHAALADDFTVIFSNPAGFVSTPPVFSASELVISISGPVFDIASLAVEAINGGTSIVSKLANLLDANGRLYTSLDVSGPVAFGFTGKGLGFGIFNRTFAELNASGASSVSFRVGEEILLAGGYAVRFSSGNHAFDFGVMPKGFLRAEVPLKSSILGLQAVLSDPTALLSTQLFRITTGIGVDLGFKYSYDRFFSVGLVGRNAYTPMLVTDYTSFEAFRTDAATAKVSTTSELALPDLAIGLAWTPDLFFLDRYLSSVKILFDYSDMLCFLRPTYRNPILNASLGLELVAFDILSLRVGIYEALLNAGFSIDLSALTLDLAMRGKELGLEPGQRPVYDLLFGIVFRY